MLNLGCAVADITPALGLPLSGFIFRQNKPSTGVDTPLWVRALALQSEGQTLLLLNYDLLGLCAALEQQILDQLQSRLGLTKDQCVLVATHTHSAPPTAPLQGEAGPDPDYGRLLEERTVEAAQSALNHLEPVTLYQATLPLSGLTYNRRALLTDGRVSMAIQPDAPVVERGPLDDRLTVLLWRNTQGQNVAAALHFACHGVAVCTQAIGGDIPGELAQRVGHMLGTPCLFLPGAGGDINPTTVATGRTELLAWIEQAMGMLATLLQQFQPVATASLHAASTDLRLDYAPLPPRAQVEERIANLERIAQGDVLSAEVQETVRSLGNIMNVKPGQPPDQAKAAYAAMALAQAGRRTLAVLDSGQTLPGLPLRLAVWRFGSIVLAFVAAEIFAITGRRIQALQPEINILPVACASPLLGYVPDRQALGQGGYEVDDAWRFYGQPAPFAPDSEQRIINSFKQMLQ